MNSINRFIKKFIPNLIPNLTLDQQLLRAASRGYSDEINGLVRKGANINYQSMHGNTPLHYASYRGHVGTIKALKQLGANLEIKNYYFHTALFVASICGHLESARQLVGEGADIKALDGFNRNALEVVDSRKTISELFYKNNNINLLRLFFDLSRVLKEAKKYNFSTYFLKLSSNLNNKSKYKLISDAIRSNNLEKLINFVHVDKLLDFSKLLFVSKEGADIFKTGLDSSEGDINIFQVACLFKENSSSCVGDKSLKKSSYLSFLNDVK